MTNYIKYTIIPIGPKDLYREITDQIKSDWYIVNASKYPDSAYGRGMELFDAFKMAEWCKENCTGRWSISERKHSIEPIFYFKTVRDRLAFILAWC